ncbi:hypothetical protein GALMADRAFT_147458 [Galerina marginata CBS 339.88]|uniref:Arrestin-like N-terminal domain-containing protein n=1 Tax=Galerina marginata (strain CBS 339.88) TaxID=685588 RepID=A0A067SAP9_GALM3|nr:hypothetical protein GALMADRAFT_147458 [Galerina marginata CBS 339.88]
MSTPIRTPSNASGISQARRRFNIFNRRLSYASSVSLATIDTVLPEYQSRPSTEMPPEFDETSQIEAFETLLEDRIEGENGSGFTHVASLPPSPTLSSSSMRLLSLPTHPVLSNSAVGLNRSGSLPHFEYSFPIKSWGRRWATLHTFSLVSIPGMANPPRIKPATPLFYGGEPISGLLELDLKSLQKFQEISISASIDAVALRGTYFTGYVDSTFKFLDYNHILWNESMGEPPSTTRQTNAREFDGNLSGSYQLSFSFPFPPQVDSDRLPYPSEFSSLPQNITQINPFPVVPGSRSEAVLPLPPPHANREIEPFLLDSKFSVSSPRRPLPSANHIDPFTRASVPLPPVNANRIDPFQKTSIPLQQSSHQMGRDHFPTPPSFSRNDLSWIAVCYELSVTFVDGQSRSSNKLTVPISYMPTTTPPPASEKRQKAYRANNTPPGPYSDPDGWINISLPLSVVEGVNVTCTFLLAKPLSYTRGTAINCFLTIFSEDTEALKVLADRKSPHVRLVRRLRTFRPHAASTATTLSPESMFNANRQEISRAVWQVPSGNVVQTRNIRHLEGEIQLPVDLMPSSTRLPSPLVIDYFVELLPFRLDIFQPGFKGNSTPHPPPKVLASSPVSITTMHSPGLPRRVAVVDSVRSQRSQRM